jgi:hypothetical protein
MMPERGVLAMTRSIARHPEGTHTSGSPESQGTVSKRHREAQKSEDVPIPISRSSIAQTITAVAFLILVTLISFTAVMVIGELFTGNSLAYWMIELMFALLCGGAGALVGGSAIVRSTLNIPGGPVHATLGGAVSMVIVGFAVAYLARPPAEDPTYAVAIHDLPDRITVDGDEYRVFVGALNSDLSFSRDSSNVSIRIPAKEGVHPLQIAIYQPVGKDRSRTFVRCELVFNTLDRQHTSPTPMDLAWSHTAPQFHLYFSANYIETAIKDSMQRNDVINNPSCLEGNIETKADRTPLDRLFTLQPNSIGSRAASLLRLGLLPRYSVLARDRANVDPLDTQPDLPPQAKLVPSIRGTAGGTFLLSPDARQDAVPPMPRTGAGPSTRVEEPSLAAAAPEPAAAAEVLPLSEQVDAYVRGEDLDRTLLYQSWGDVAEYVMKGLRNEFAKGSNRVAPYLNLISNALNVLDEGNYLAPTLRPNRDQSTKSDRLSNNQGIPGFSRNDYEIVVDSLCSADEDVRRAAQRLLKIYPSNYFYGPLQALPSQANFDKCEISFVAETATYYFYNRIVEYDGTFTLNKQNLAWINENYAEGSDWARRAEAQDGSAVIFTAMLDYARGLVLWDHDEKKGASASLNQMIDSIRASNRIYPSNPQHIATALRLIHNLRNPKSLNAATVFNPPDRGTVSTGYAISESAVSLYAVPESGKPIGKMKSDATARIYLRLDNWDLLEGGGQIGWAQRAAARRAAR